MSLMTKIMDDVRTPVAYEWRYISKDCIRRFTVALALKMSS